MNKEAKQIARSKKWTKRVCLTTDNYQFIVDTQKNLGYKTVAGTLDMIINDFKNKEYDETKGAKGDNGGNPEDKHAFGSGPSGEPQEAQRRGDVE